ncbi:MAG: metallophosphoesterase [Chlorobium sp.]|nr:MAG: metallophosphoesterase [Chlorobium sp.]
MLIHNNRHCLLRKVMQDAVTINIDNSSKIVILSDLHMGNGGRNDEFRQNAELVKNILDNYYFNQKYSLLLNGDIEELYKFSLESISARWQDMFDLFLKFQENGFFLKTYGNHDAILFNNEKYPFSASLVESVKLKYGNETILVFHGHQVSTYLWKKYSFLNDAIVFILRYFAKPIGIKNFSVAYNSRKKYVIEKAIYEFSNRFKIISVIGHTHRPLFESLSKVDYLKFRIEALCRTYPELDEEERLSIKETIDELKSELCACISKSKRNGIRTSVYNEITIPSVFNSGCTIGKRGITALEIDSGVIKLVYWYDGKQSPRFKSERNNRPIVLESTDISRIVLNEDSLDYVFSRLHLLS